MRLPMLRSMRRASLSKEQFEGVVVDYLQVRHTHTHTLRIRIVLLVLRSG